MGPKRIAWGYDPVLLTETYTMQHYLKAFEEMAQTLAPYIDRCVFSFVEMHKKLKTKMPELIPLTQQDMNTLAEGLDAVAAKYGIFLQTCGTKGDFTGYGIHASGCMTLDILGNANQIQFRNLKHRGTRQGCLCIESRDIGAYNTCLNGCKYCYANKNPEKAFENYQYHTPASPLLLGNITPEDTVTQSPQKSFLK